MSLGSKDIKCPICGSPAHKIIYAGLPMYFCKDDLCSCLWGFWSLILDWGLIEFNGYIFVYEGNYFKALWHWLLDKEDDHDDR